MISKSQLRRFIKRCQSDPMWFMNSLCTISHPKAGGIKLNLFSYQMSCLEHFRKNRFNIFNKTRQSGISTITGIYALWTAMMFPHRTILITSKGDRDSKEFLRRNVRFVYDHLPGWVREIWQADFNEHVGKFSNGSRITSLPSGPEVLRSNSSSLNIIDESSATPHMDEMWTSGAPCVRADTLIQTSEGLVEIGDLHAVGEWTDLDITVPTDDGIQKCNKLYSNGVAETIVINTEFGYELEGTPHHRIRSIDEDGNYVWKKLGLLSPGDMTVTLPGCFSGKRQFLDDSVELDPDLAEIIGLYVGDGTINRMRPKRLRIHFDPQDVNTRDKIVDQINQIVGRIGFSTCAYSQESPTTAIARINSAELIDLFHRNGIISKTSSRDAEIPDIILSSDRSVLCAFLRGLFDSDGYCFQSSTSLKIGLSSASEKLIRQAQIALHALGIISKIEKCETMEGRFSDDLYWRLTIYDASNKIKFKEIGFISPRKQKILDQFVSDREHYIIDHYVLAREFASAALHAIAVDGSVRKSNDHRKRDLYRIARIGRVKMQLVRELSEEFNLGDRLSNYIRRGFQFDRVACVRQGKTEVFDLSVPKNNTYIANGIINHNTLQHGGSVIIVATSKGVGNWYWKTWTDAKAGHNEFNTIELDWWEMDWSISYVDENGIECTICPTAGIRECTTPEEIAKYGKYWSPWLEEQYQLLVQKGDDKKFRQEVLREFIGTGDTLFKRHVLARLVADQNDDYEVIPGGIVDYVNPMTEHRRKLDFGEDLWIWHKPQPDHIYAVGGDIATGEGDDYSVIEVLDATDRVQAAEYQGKVSPKTFAYMLDWIARWYGYAIINPERSGIGMPVCDELEKEILYPNLYRYKRVNKAKVVGFLTVGMSRNTIIKHLLDHIAGDAEDDDTFMMYSSRFAKEAQIFVRKSSGKYEAENGAGNNDDTMIGTGLALIAAKTAWQSNVSHLLPVRASNMPELKRNESRADMDRQIKQEVGNIVVPLSSSVLDDTDIYGEIDHMSNFTKQLLNASVPPIPMVSSRKHQIKKK